MRAHRDNAGLGPLALTAPRRTLTERTLYPPPPPLGWCVIFCAVFVKQLFPYHLLSVPEVVREVSGERKQLTNKDTSQPSNGEKQTPTTAHVSQQLTLRIEKWSKHTASVYRC